MAPYQQFLPRDIDCNPGFNFYSCIYDGQSWEGCCLTNPCGTPSFCPAQNRDLTTTLSIATTSTALSSAHSGPTPPTVDDLGSSTSSPFPLPTDSNPDSPAARSSANYDPTAQAGAAVAATVGTLVGIGAIALFLWVLHVRRRNKERQTKKAKTVRFKPAVNPVINAEPPFDPTRFPRRRRSSDLSNTAIFDSTPEMDYRFNYYPGNDTPYRGGVREPPAPVVPPSDWTDYFHYTDGTYIRRGPSSDGSTFSRQRTNNIQPNTTTSSNTFTGKPRGYTGDAPDAPSIRIPQPPPPAARRSTRNRTHSRGRTRSRHTARKSYHFEVRPMDSPSPRSSIADSGPDIRSPDKPGPHSYRRPRATSIDIGGVTLRPEDYYYPGRHKSATAPDSGGDYVAGSAAAAPSGGLRVPYKPVEYFNGFLPLVRRGSGRTGPPRIPYKPVDYMGRILRPVRRRSSGVAEFA